MSYFISYCIRTARAHYGPKTTTDNLQRDHLSHLFTEHGFTSHKPLLQEWLKLNLQWGTLYTKQEISIH